MREPPIILEILKVKMNTQRVIEKLKKEYPGKNIILNPPDNPTEIVCEIEPGSVNPDKSVAIAILDSTVKHSHRIAKETYEVLSGVLELTKGGKTFFMTPGQKMEIEPGEFHLATGNETWVKVISKPAWSPEDHFLSIEEATK